MKIANRRPDAGVVVVRDESDHFQYELYAIEATLIGKIKRTGHRAMAIIDDGRGNRPSSNLTFVTIEQAAQHLLSIHDRMDLADRIPGQENRRAKKAAEASTRRKVTGWDLVDRKVWTEFAEMRGLNARDKDALTRLYELTADEERLLDAVGSIHPRVHGRTAD